MGKRLREAQRKEAQRISVRASVLKRAWLVREIRLTGDLDATIEYNLRGALVGAPEVDGAFAGPHSGVVIVKGVLITSLRRQAAGNGFSVHFPLQGKSDELRVGVRATLEFGFVPRISALSVSVNGIIVYEEIGGRLVRPTPEDETLPIPSATSCQTDADLPIPTANGGS
jgi:hypothetical protein